MRHPAISFSGDMLDMDGSSFTFYDIFDENPDNDTSFTLNPDPSTVTGPGKMLELKHLHNWDDGGTLNTPPFSPFRPKLPEESVDFSDYFLTPQNDFHSSKLTCDNTSFPDHIQSEQKMEQDNIHLDLDLFTHDEAEGRMEDATALENPLDLISDMVPDVEVTNREECASDAAYIDDSMDYDNILPTQESWSQSNKLDVLITGTKLLASREKEAGSQVNAYIKEHIAGMDWNSLEIIVDPTKIIPQPAPPFSLQETKTSSPKQGNTMVVVKVGDSESCVIQEFVRDETGVVQKIAVVMINDELIRVPIIENIERLFSPTVLLERLAEPKTTPANKSAKRLRTAKSTENSAGRPSKKARQNMNAGTPVSWKDKDLLPAVGQIKRGRGRPRKTLVENGTLSISAGNTPTPIVPIKIEDCQTPVTEQVDQARSADARSTKYKYGLRNRNTIKHSV